LEARVEFRENEDELGLGQVEKGGEMGRIELGNGCVDLGSERGEDVRVS
jgi:hypothetical protein